MKNKNIYLSFTIFVLALLGLINNLKAQTFINPYIGYGAAKLNFPLPIGFDPNLKSHDKVYSKSTFLGFSLIKILNKYWSIDFQSDIGYQKFLRSDISFSGDEGSYFWQFRNSIIPKVFVGEKWRVGIGLNFDFLNSNHIRYDRIRKRAEFGSILQVNYLLNENFNLHLNCRHTLKAIDFRYPSNLDPHQSLNLGLGYRLQIEK